MLDAICSENATAAGGVSQHGSYSRTEAFRFLVGEKIHCTAFGLNLYFYPSPPVSLSSFGSCRHHISILFSELYRGKNSNR